jgi:hypothetical protein
MAEKAQILTALRKLAACYNKEPTQAQVQLYLEMLEEVEQPALDFAVQTWIKTSPFYPRINELLKTAASYAPPPAPPAQVLLMIQYQLQHDFYKKGQLDPERWEKLAQDFERHDRIHSAQACRKRFRNYQSLQAKVLTALQESE